MTSRFHALVSLLSCALLATSAAAQMLPASAHVNLYFPQVADGGSVNVWQTTLTFMNPNPASTAHVTAVFSDNTGADLAVFDSGSGPVAQIDVTIPPLGVRVVKTRKGTTEREGWGVAYSDIPIQGIASYRRYDSGKATLEVADNATLPTFSYVSYANSMLAVAIANVYSVPMPVLVTAFDTEGNKVAGPLTVQLPAFGHKSFNLGNQLSLPANFEGSISIDSTTNGPMFFLAWTLNVSDAGLLATLPPGRYTFPDSQVDRIENVFYTVLDQAYAAYDIPSGVSVSLDWTEDRQVSAGLTFDASGAAFQITLATGELMATSDSELAFLIGHYMGHVVRHYSGQRLYYDDSEVDADAVGMRLALWAGYDPYAAAGLFGKLRMASTDAQLLGTILGSNTTSNPYSDFGSRGDTLVQLIRDMCGPTLESCQAYKDLVHPHAPDPYPLSRRPRPRTRR